MQNFKEQIRLQRLQLTHSLYVQSRGLCERCSENGPVDLHEALVTRRDVQGWDDERKLLIFVAQNSLLLCRECHSYLQPRRQEAYELLCDLRGKANVDMWLHNIRKEFKSTMQNFEGQNEPLVCTMQANNEQNVC